MRLLTLRLTLPLLGALTCANASAQVRYAAGDILALDDTLQQYVHVPTSGGMGAAATPLTIPGAFIPPSPIEAYDFDHLTGDLIYTAPLASGEIGVYRNELDGLAGAPSVVAQTLAGVIAGSTGWTVVDLHAGEHGSFLLLATNGVDQAVFRFGLGSAGLVSHVVRTMPPSEAPSPLTRVASRDSGGILLAEPRAPGNPQQSRVLTIEGQIGGSVPTSTLINNFDVRAVEGDPNAGAATLFAGGNPFPFMQPTNPPTPNTLNFMCTTWTQVYTTVSDPTVLSGVGGIVEDIDNTAIGGQLICLAAPAGPSALVVRGYCGAGGPSFNVLSSPNRLTRAKYLTTTAEYGYSGFMPNGSGGFAPVRVGGPATAPINTTATFTMTGGVPNTGAAFRLGLSDQVQGNGQLLPLDLAPYGAPGSAMFASDNVFQPMALNAAGSATIAYFVPNDPALIGLLVYAQWETSSGTAAATSNAIRTLIIP